MTLHNASVSVIPVVRVKVNKPSDINKVGKQSVNKVGSLHTKGFLGILLSNWAANRKKQMKNKTLVSSQIGQHIHDMGDHSIDDLQTYLNGLDIQVLKTVKLNKRKSQFFVILCNKDQSVLTLDIQPGSTYTEEYQDVYEYNYYRKGYFPGPVRPEILCGGTSGENRRYLERMKVIDPKGFSKIMRDQKKPFTKSYPKIDQVEMSVVE